MFSVVADDLRRVLKRHFCREFRLTLNNLSGNAKKE
jgi:hypothetical protein